MKKGMPARRDFMKMAAVAATGAALAAPAQAAGKRQAPVPTKPAASGYQKTAHVRRYYDLARQI